MNARQEIDVVEQYGMLCALVDGVVYTATNPFGLDSAIPGGPGRDFYLRDGDDPKYTWEPDRIDNYWRAISDATPESEAEQ